MATTTNYAWSTPDNTAYVKDGASAIRTLGSSVDTTLYTALGGAYPGLRLIKKQTIGSAVSSITVTNAFSATYENYKIVVSGGVASTDTTMSITLGAAVTGYYGSLIYAPYTTGVVACATDNNGNRFTYVGGGTTSTLTANFDLINPFLTKTTQLLTNHTRAASSSYSGNYGGFLNNATSFTDVNILAASGTFTGGTIYIYGYGAS